MKLAQSNIESFDSVFVTVSIVLQLNVSSLAMIISPFALLMVDLLVVVVVLCVRKPPVCANPLRTHLLFAASSLVGVTFHKEKIFSYSCVLLSISLKTSSCENFSYLLIDLLAN